MPKKKAAKPKPKKKTSKKAAAPKPVPMLTCPVTGARIPADQAAALGH